MNKEKAKLEKNLRRRARTRAKISGSDSCPRLSVSRTLKHVYAQLIDDVSRKTLVAASDAEIKGKKTEAGELKGKTATAYLVGKLLAEKAEKKNIKKVVFDRAHRKYHGRVKALADGAREGGLQF